MAEKDGFLGKFGIKDYRNELELILEGKNIDEEAQSLILSIFYKLDNFYKDYALVKGECKTKSEFIEDFINTIKLKCNRIDILPAQECSKNDRYKVDIQKGKIKCFPSENVLFYAISKLNERYDDVENYGAKDFHNLCVNYVLTKGKTINTIEPVRDFNGWSWNYEIGNPEKIVFNLIFQNVLILFGYDFIFKNIDNHNIVKALKEELNNKAFSESGYEFIECLIEICVDLYNNASAENHEICLRNKGSIEKKLSILKNRKEYINAKSHSNAGIIKKIQKIDIVLNDVNLTTRVFKKNLEAGRTKCHTVSEFIDVIEKKRRKLLKKIDDNNNLLSPKEYLKNCEKYEKLLNFYDSVKENEKKINIQTKLLKLQKAFLECEKSKIAKEDNKKNMYNLTRELRYYSNIPYNTNKRVYMQEKLKNKLEEVQKELIFKMIENKVTDIGFKTKQLNFEILKYMFITKVIGLDNLSIKVSSVNDNQVEVEYYDAKTLDYKQTFSIPNDEVNIGKKDRKFKLLKIGG